MERIAEILIRRDGLSREDANSLVEAAREELYDRLENDENAYDICEEFFGLEPDYLDELMG